MRLWLVLSCFVASDLVTSACECVTPSPLMALQSADLVFHGTVTETEPHDETTTGTTLTVEAVWKGPVELDIQVVTPNSATACGAELTTGSGYVLFANVQDGLFLVDSCQVVLHSTSVTTELGTPLWTRDIFRRGDPNADGRHDLSDVIFTLQYMFGRGRAPGCLKSADANSDEKVDIADALYMLGTYFYGRGTIAAPYPFCGATTVVDRLTCAAYPQCDEGPPTSHDIWLSRAEIMALPTSGEGWNNLLEAANSTPSAPRLGDQDSTTDVTTLAKALVYVRTGEPRYRAEVIDLCMRAIDSEGGSTLGLGRGLVAYVIAADLVGLDPQDDVLFSAWLRRVLTKEIDDRTLQSTHEDRPNNWGTHAGASRAAVAIYLGDLPELQRTAQVFKGFLGDRSSYANFKYGALDWQADPDNPVGINPKGAIRDGYDVDGVIPDDMRRGDTLQFPPVPTGYAWESLQGIVVQAEILYRAGFDTWNWEDQAILRAVQFLHRIDWLAEGDDTWQIPLINRRYGTAFPLTESVRSGKNMGWTDWTHG